MRRVLMAMVLTAVSTTAAAAQAGRYGYVTPPKYYVGLSYGYLGGTTIEDGNLSWQLGYTSQIRATLERRLQRGFTAGVSAGFANAPLTYSVGGLSPGFGTTQANAEVTQLMAYVFGGGSGVGFHGLYDLEAGFTHFANFHDASTNQGLNGRATDFTFGLGGGLGFGFSPLADAYITEQDDFILDSPGGQVGTRSNAPRQFTFRAGFRYGF